ncbi:hypothetical protein F0562_022946 [Nyssa sinensis]|uniref:Uncharacterized protein n=1 Tax=Nyssa sinensis TaxID=561372 RepID=A0A5J5BGJ0_9ASTE|nr:hypothetical protein F0562_022946 [Nyssa sinensis]
MEATREADGLLDKIRPPRIEDAGLEDCALPPESIREAFLKAATAVGSRAASIFSASGDENDNSECNCVNDPWPAAKESSDTLVGIKPEAEPSGPCAAEKGGGMPEVLGDEVAANFADAEERADKVVGLDVPKGGEEACVDGLQGLKIGEKVTLDKDKNLNDDDGDEEREGERPILAEAYGDGFHFIITRGFVVDEYQNCETFQWSIASEETHDLISSCIAHARVHL